MDQTLRTLNKYHWYEHKKEAKALAETPDKPREKWGIAVSGCRDSMVCFAISFIYLFFFFVKVLAHVLSKLLKDKVDLFGVFVDFGMKIKDNDNIMQLSDVFFWFYL